jgi:hypothetical protein
MTPIEDLKHDITILIRCIEELIKTKSQFTTEYSIVQQTYHNLRHKHSHLEVFHEKV